MFLFNQNRSSLRAEVNKPAYGAFVDIDIKKDGKFSLRNLVGETKKRAWPPCCIFFFYFVSDLILQLCSKSSHLVEILLAIKTD